MSVLSNYFVEDIPAGWSQTGGQTCSVLGDIDPAGSSTGCAVGLAAGFCAVSIGVETNGSIVSPMTLSTPAI